MSSMSAKISADPEEFVLQLAREITDSPEEAAAAIEQMHEDIRRCGEGDHPADQYESRILNGIAWRRLFEILRRSDRMPIVMNRRT